MKSVSLIQELKCYLQDGEEAQVLISCCLASMPISLPDPLTTVSSDHYVAKARSLAGSA
ncbi:Dna-Directed Dna/Rna polymerase Mu, partial [Manis pentadactyla]